MLNLLRYKDENFHNRIAEIINSRKNFDEDITNQVNDIILDIKNNGNISLFKYMSKYDNVECSAENICYSKEDILSAKKNCTRESIEAIKLAKNRIEAFHQHQLPGDSIEDYAIRDDSKIEKLQVEDVVKNSSKVENNFFAVTKVIDEE